MNYFESKLQNVVLGEGDLSQFTVKFHTWLIKINARKQGSLMKSFFLSQISITKEEIKQNLTTNMTSNEWKRIATNLKCTDIPHAWFIIKENYLRYC